MTCRSPHGSRRRSTSSRTASSSGTPRGGLEILGQQRFCVERGDEAVDLVAHVRVHELLEVADHLLGSLVQALVEVVHEVLREDAGGVPLAVRAPQRYAPVL